MNGLAALTVAALLAAAPSAEEQQSLAAAKASYAEGNPEQTLKQLIPALASQDAALAARAHLLRADCLRLLHAPKGELEAELRAALSADPEAQLDPSREPPDLVAALAELRAGSRGRLVIRANRADARVLLDGAPLGPLPFIGPVGIGRHHLVAEAPEGTARVDREVVVHLDQTAEVELSLPPPPHPELRATAGLEPKPNPVGSALGPVPEAQSSLLATRHAGWGLLALGGLAAVTSGISYGLAFSTRSQLLGQVPPIDVAARNRLIRQGETQNAVGLGALLLSGAAGGGAVLCLAVLP